ncbi:hypothetical protein C8Q80DRAFT_915162 [Daedaleopsis nitida]|nr:hypothetical protein C8Q80DRAFT_915162 [Daedaleopsis nitida]
MPAQVLHLSNLGWPPILLALLLTTIVSSGTLYLAHVLGTGYIGTLSATLLSTICYTAICIQASPHTSDSDRRLESNPAHVATILRALGGTCWTLFATVRFLCRSLEVAFHCGAVLFSLACHVVEIADSTITFIARACVATIEGVIWAFNTITLCASIVTCTLERICRIGGALSTVVNLDLVRWIAKTSNGAVYNWTSSVVGGQDIYSSVTAPSAWIWSTQPFIDCYNRIRCSIKVVRDQIQVHARKRDVRREVLEEHGLEGILAISHPEPAVDSPAVITPRDKITATARSPSTQRATIHAREHYSDATDSRQYAHVVKIDALLDPMESKGDVEFPKCNTAGTLNVEILAFRTTVEIDDEACTENAHLRGEVSFQIVYGEGFTSVFEHVNHSVSASLALSGADLVKTYVYTTSETTASTSADANDLPSAVSVVNASTCRTTGAEDLESIHPLSVVRHARDTTYSSSELEISDDPATHLEDSDTTLCEATASQALWKIPSLPSWDQVVWDIGRRSCKLPPSLPRESVASQILRILGQDETRLISSRAIHSFTRLLQLGQASQSLLKDRGGSTSSGPEKRSPTTGLELVPARGSIPSTLAPSATSAALPPDGQPIKISRRARCRARKRAAEAEAQARAAEAQLSSCECVLTIQPSQPETLAVQEDSPLEEARDDGAGPAAPLTRPKRMSRNARVRARNAAARRAQAVQAVEQELGREPTAEEVEEKLEQMKKELNWATRMNHARTASQKAVVAITLRQALVAAAVQASASAAAAAGRSSRTDTVNGVEHHRDIRIGDGQATQRTVV